MSAQKGAISMTNAMTKPSGSNYLPVLATKINNAHRQAREAAKVSLQRAIEVGEYLIEAKEQVGHGDWLAWLTDNVAFSDRSAQAYMQCARHKDEINTKTAAAADLTLREGLETISFEGRRTRDLFPILAFVSTDQDAAAYHGMEILFCEDKGNELRPAKVSHVVCRGGKNTFTHFQKPLSHDVIRRALDIEIQSTWTYSDGQPLAEWRDVTPEHMAELVAAMGSAA